MGWIWNNNVDNYDKQRQDPRSDCDDDCSTKKVIQSHCRTEEVEPGKFIRKCEKTEQLLRSCAGRPLEVVKSNTEYTEDDVTREMTGESIHTRPLRRHPLEYDNRRQEMLEFETMVMFHALNSIYEMAGEMMSGISQAVLGYPQKIPIGDGQQEETEALNKERNNQTKYSELAGEVKDV